MQRYARTRRSVLRGASASPVGRIRRRTLRASTFWKALEPSPREPMGPGSVIVLGVTVTPPTRP